MTKSRVDSIWTREGEAALTLQAGRSRQIQLIKRLHDGGGKLLVGTDAIVLNILPGHSLHVEMEAFVEAGLSNCETLVCCCRNPAPAATRMRTVLDVRLPFAANHIMSSLQVAIVLSLVGCVVSELVAARAGLGYIIALYANELKPAIMFASVISLAIMGALLGSLVMFLHRRVVFWVK